jgi:recombination protein RecT
MSNSGAWKNSWDEMAKKTVLRRLCKHIETDFESTEAMKAWEDGSDSNIATVERSGEVVDAFAEHDIVDVDFKEVENE